MGFDLIPRRVQRQSGTKPHDRIKELEKRQRRVQLVASANSGRELGVRVEYESVAGPSPSSPSTSSSKARISTDDGSGMDSGFDLDEAKREELGPISNELFKILSPLHLRSSEKSKDLLAKLSDSTKPLHVNHLLEHPDVRTLCQGSVEVASALRLLAPLGWILLEPDGYNFRLASSTATLLSSRADLWKEAASNGSIIYLENIPLGWDTESKVAQFVQALIREEVDKRNPVGQIDAFVLDVSIPSPYPNPWEEGYESSEARHSHPFFKVPPGKRKRERRPIPGHCFVTLTPSAKGKDAARILCQQWPWSLHSLGQRGLGFDSMPQASKQAKAAGLRCLSLSGWESLRVEYERWRGLLRQSHRASKVGTERYDPSPKGEACGDGGKARDLNTSSKAREGDPIIQDVVAKRKIVDSGTAIGVEPRLTGPNSRHDEQQQLDYPRHTILRISCPGTMAEEGQVKGKGRGSSSEKVKGSIKARLEKLRPESVDYVDLVDGGDKCFIRTPNQEVATALKEAIAKAESAKARGDKAGSQAGQGKGVVSFGWVAEILSGEEEGNYWSRLPQRVRNSAKKKSMVSSSRVSETPTTSRADRVDDGTTETVEDGVGSKEVGSGDRADKGRSGKKRKKRKRERMEGDGLEVEGEEAMDG